MNTSKKYSLLVCWLLTVGLFAQEPPLSDAELQVYHDRAIQEIEAFQSSIKLVGNPEYPDEIRLETIANQMKSFSKDAKMQVSSLNSAKPREYAMEAYLKRLMRLPYDLVFIEFNTSAFRISEWEKTVDPKTGETLYMGTATIEQVFKGECKESNNGAGVCKKSYKDVTKKNIQIYLRKINCYEEEGGCWVVLLGDVTVRETR